MAVKNIYWAAAFLLILISSLVVNCLFWIVFFRRKRLKSKGHFTLLFAMSLVDALVGGVWTGLSAVASLLDWEFPLGVCRFQSFLLTLTQSLTALILATVALERLLRMVKPSRHSIVFVPKVTLFAVVALVVFCGVISSIHLYGMVSTSWHSSEHQCGADFTENVRLLDMTFCFDHAIPYYVIALPAFVAAFIRVFLARRHPSQFGEIVLERNAYAPSDSYSARLAKLQAKFRGANKTSGGKSGGKSGKSVTPTLGQRVYSSKGYTEPDHWDSDIDDGTDDHDDDNKKNNDKDKKNKKRDSRERVHSLSRPEYSMLLMSAIVTLVTALLWFPWIVMRFVWNKTPREDIPEGAATIAILCMHSAAVVKPIVYLVTNPFFRSAVVKTLCGRRNNRELLISPGGDDQKDGHHANSNANLGFEAEA